MNAEKLQAIRKAENSVKELLLSVEKMVHETIREAHIGAETLVENAKKEARIKEEKTLADYRHKGEQQAQEILSQLDEELKKIEALSDSNESKAIDYLKQQMKVNYGNN